VTFLVIEANNRRNQSEPLTDARAMEIAEQLRSEYRRFSYDGNIPALTTLYATGGVEYFRMKNVGREEIAADAQKFFGRIERTDRFDVEISRVNRLNDSTFTTRWVIRYERLKDDGTILRGEAVNDYTVRRFDDDWLIVREKQQAIRRNDEVPPPPDTTSADTVAAADRPDSTEVASGVPDEQTLRNAVKSIILLANNGQAAQAWEQYASPELKARMQGFPDPIPQGSLSLRSVSVNGLRAGAEIVQSRGFAGRDLTITFSFAAGDGLRLTGVSVSE